MAWNDLFDINNKPTMEDIYKYIGEEFDLWGEMLNYLEQTYSVKPKLTYSKCPMQTGWNVKYQKSNKSLCTLYPMEGYFIALIVIGAKENKDTEEISETLTPYVENLYQSVPFSCGGRWLMINVTDKDILNDVKKLISIRIKNK